RLRIGRVDVLVSSRSQQVFDPEVFRMHGIDVRRAKLVALKSAQHFRAGFEPIAAGIVTADAPGLTSLRLESFPRTRTRRPIWPLDAGAEYPERPPAP
ncbi:MAG TPA: MlrC C-terminal domain-containing protein, partial [Myxococcota bacterium]|nr:MlrC C-terminal domain-containing protein [Myxococcota bacterium]